MLHRLIRVCWVVPVLMVVASCAIQTVAVKPSPALEAELAQRFNAFLGTDGESLQQMVLLPENQQLFEQLRYLSIGARQEAVSQLPSIMQYFIGVSRVNATPTKLLDMDVKSYIQFMLSIAPIHFLKQTLRERPYQLKLQYANDSYAIAYLVLDEHSEQIPLHFQRYQSQWVLDIEPYLFLLDKLLVVLLEQNKQKIEGIDWALMGYVFNRQTLPDNLQIPDADNDASTQLSAQKYVSVYHNYLLLWQAMSEKKAIEAQGDSIEFLHDFGITLSYIGNRVGANTYFEWILAQSPDYVPVYHSIAIDLIANGQFAQGSQYLSKAIQLAPENPFNDRVLGYLHFYQQQFEPAAQAFERYIQQQPTEKYAFLWHYLAQRKLQLPSQQLQTGLQQYIKNTRNLQWPDAIFDYFLDNINEEGLFFLAQDRDASKYREQICEAYFYVGFMLYLEQDFESAASYFKAAVSTDVHGFFEYDLAKHILSDWPEFATLD